MEMKLAENIRSFRKERSLTQEQLAEVLGVTTGAVHKWEAKLSIPDLELIVEMADFFDTSVDVLLGYEIKDNRLEATVRRLQDYRRQKDWAGLTEAEKALKKYPHSFRIVCASEGLYRVFGFETGNKDALRRSLELLQQSLLLIDQNEDPQISEQTLYARMAENYLSLAEEEKGIELLKKHNAGGLYNAKIGHALAVCEHTEEAASFLSEALAKILSDLCDTIIGYVNFFLTRGDHASAQAILRWGIGLFAGLRKDGKPNFLDKVNCVLLASLAGSELMSGQEEAARASLREARQLAAFFDASPSYDESDIRFIDRIEGASAHDDIGATAMAAIDNVINEFANTALTALWESITTQEEAQ